MTLDKQNKQELTVYALLWGILFVAPLLMQFATNTRNDQTMIHMADVLFVWKKTGLFLAAFLVHNFLLAPLLIERQRRWLYFSLVTLLLAGFVVVQCAQRPNEDHLHQHNELEELRPPHPIDRLHDWPPDDMWPADIPPEDVLPDNGPGHQPGGERPPLLLGQHDVMAIIILVLMLGMNLGVKLYFRQRRDQQRMQLLERQNLQQQLEYLRYQVNPHFLMNTLNNIHALVDIDAERAKESIVELSKIMRFVLYEGSKPMVPLSQELAFTEHYITLMRMRVTDRVGISVQMPQSTPGLLIPPLILITFIENAFKHGVSYRQPSFIDISVSVADRRLSFCCRNSKLAAEDDHHGGVGLKNVRQRLDLIFGKDYTLDIDDQADTYSVSLNLPLQPQPPESHD